MGTQESFDTLIETLRSKPDEQELHHILKKLVKDPPSTRNETLALVLVLLSTTVPEVYWQIPQLKGSIAACCTSIIGLGNLLARINMANKSKEYTLLQSFIDILVRICRDKVVTILMSSASSRSEIAEIERYFFKGKIYLATAELDLHYVESTIFSSIDSYCAFLASQIHDTLQTSVSQAIPFIHSAFSFHPKFSGHMFNLLFRSENLHLFISILKELKSFQRKRLLERFWCEFLPSILGTDTKLEALAYILGTFPHNDLDVVLVENIVETMNTNLYRLATYRLSLESEQNTRAVTQSQLQKWGSEPAIKLESIVLQQMRTSFLILLLKNQPQECAKLLKDPLFINAVSTRLGAFSDAVKNLALVLTNELCNGADQEPIFKNLVVDEQLSALEPKFSSLDEAWDVFSQAVEVPDQEIQKLETNVASLKVDQIVNNNDSDYSSDDDDPTVRKKTIQKPLYIKDLLAYISVDTNDSAAFEKRKLAFEHGPTLIRQKLRHGSELRIYTEKLLTSLLAMTNIYEDANFEQARLNCMIAVASSDISLGAILVELLAGGDYSLQQRVTILSTLSFAARELAGIEDEFVKSSYTAKDFVSEKLPPKLHKQLIGSDDVSVSRLNSAHLALENDLMRERSEKAKDQIVGGTILRMSSKVQKTNSTHIIKTRETDFHKFIGPKFFFPLINLWHQVHGIDIGHYSPILTSHYVRTLTLILHSAYPVATDFRDMTRELLLVIVTVIAEVQLDQIPLIESIFTGILLVLDTSESQYLIETFSNELQAIEMWASAVWEKIIDEKVKSLGAGVLLRLHEISAKYERTLMGQLNSTF